jgi:hypothetical protein
MKLSRRLNLIIPVETGIGTVHVHSVPVSREVFEQHFKIIGRTLAAIYEQGLGRIAGPRTAALLLREQAEELAGRDEEARAAARRAIDQSLFSEIYRLTSVVAPTNRAVILGPQAALTSGWEPVPYQEAVKRGVIDKDDAAEVDNALAFFTVVSSMMRGADLEASLEGSRLWGGSTTLLNSTEYANSLPTSTKDASSGEKSPTSQPQRSTG